MTTGSRPVSVRWLAFLRQEDCACDFRWAGLGRLYGVSMGNGWVRTSTDPSCPHHSAPEVRS